MKREVPPVTQPVPAREPARRGSTQRISPVTHVALLALCLLLPLSCTDAVAPSQPETVSANARALGTSDPRASWFRMRKRFRTPEDVLATMQRALENKSSAGYLLALSDPTSGIGERPFRVIMDRAVLASWQLATQKTVPDPWGIEQERGLPRILFSLRPQYPYQFLWLPDPDEPGDIVDPDADTMHVSRHYRLIATPLDGSSDETLAVGFCDLSLEWAHDRWSIFRWVDRIDPTVGVNPADDARSFTSWRLESLP